MKHFTGENLSLRLGGQQVLKSVDFNLRQGEMLGLIGPNGAGKSSLLKRLACLLPQAEGRLVLDGEVVQAAPELAMARRIAYLAQNGAAHWPVSVERIVALGRLPHLGSWNKPDEQDRRVIDRVIRETGLDELRRRPFDTLSGGERARTLLARALAVEPEILLADEPVSALDPAYQLEVMELLRNHCDNGGACVVVLHDLRLAAHYCNRLQLLLRGETLAEGSVCEVLTPANLASAYQIRLCGDENVVGEAFRLSWQLLCDGQGV